MLYKVGRCLLRNRLEEAHMSQAELAEKLGITKQQINKYINNINVMSYQTAYNIASILKCDMEDLYEMYEAGSNE